MKNKAPLALMEQLIMLLVFALAAALCLQIYAFSSRLSRGSEARSFAATEVQNVAEAVKLRHGDLTSLSPSGLETDGSLKLGYDESWQQVSPEAGIYHILVIPQKTDVPGLGKATVAAQTAEGEAIFGITAAWQEVAHE